ncbi:MAG TPA: GGDEF domain-containing protein [Dongiaceae bacterium]|nr:GGDEF domain-containing protein [Dongiaceae bacterium]
MASTEVEELRFMQSANGHQPAAAPTTNKRTPVAKKRAASAEVSIEESLSSAVLASDTELARILREVDEISKSLRGEFPDVQALRVAQHPAVWGAVKQTLLERELRLLALTDDLTCLYNRRGFFAVATQLLKVAQRKSQNCLLFYCDVDNLKKINDSFGHHEGDLALIRVADALEHSFRESDAIARIGGDEFVVIGLEASSRIETTLLRRLDRNIRKASAGETRYQLSVSVGVARFDPKRAVSLGELMSQADLAMYEQKRKQVNLVEPPLQIEEEVVIAPSDK